MPSGGARRKTPRTAVPTSRVGEARPRAPSSGSVRPASVDDPDNDNYRGPGAWGLLDTPKRPSRPSSSQDTGITLAEATELLAEVRDKAYSGRPEDLKWAARTLTYLAEHRIEDLDRREDALVRREQSLERRAAQFEERIAREGHVLAVAKTDWESQLARLRTEVAETRRTLKELKTSESRARAQREREVSKHAKRLAAMTSRSDAALRRRRDAAAETVEAIARDLEVVMTQLQSGVTIRFRAKDPSGGIAQAARTARRAAATLRSEKRNLS
jgi:chromosome segregation ATPase